MPIKGTKVTDAEKKRIIAFYQLDNSMGACATKYGRSKGIIKKIIDEAKSGKFGDYVNKVEQIQKNNTKEILSLLKEDTRTYQVMDKMLNLINSESVLKNLLKDKGLQQFTSFMGMNYDKIYKSKEIALKQEVLNLNHKIFETYNPGNDNFKGAMGDALKTINFDKVSLDNMIEPESKKSKDV